MLRKVLSGYTLYIDGVDRLGLVSGFTPPTIDAESVTSNMPGHAGPLEILTGRVGALEITFSMADAFPELESLCANPAALDTPVLFVGVLTDSVTRRTVEYEAAGVWTKQERSEFAGAEGSAGQGGGGAGGGERGPHTYTISCRTFTHRIDGAEVRHIDLEQNIHRANGVDLTAELRNALKRQ